MNKRAVGSDKEKMAREYLIQNGLRVLECNYRNKKGEIDIIAQDGMTLVFVEVKYRKTASLGHPEEAVNTIKMKKICNVASYYMLSKKYNSNTQCRFDVVAIEGDIIRWHKNAFEYITR